MPVLPPCREGAHLNQFFLVTTRHVPCGSTWFVTVQIRYLYRVDAETQGHTLMFPAIYTFLHSCFSKFMLFRDSFYPRFHEFHDPRSFIFPKSLKCWFVSNTSFTFILPGIFHPFPHDYLFHAISFISGKMVRHFPSSHFNPYIFRISWCEPFHTNLISFVLSP